MDLFKIETELKKRHQFPYQWGRKQNNYFDNLTDFIYRIYEFDKLIKKIDEEYYDDHDYIDLKNYALNRWYNYLSARAVEFIFCSQEGVIAETDNKNNERDFSINGINFDHKTTNFPTGYPETLDYAISNPGHLIQWLYNEQSQEKRKHLKNRLFIVLYSKGNEHWKLKAEILWLKEKIESYIKLFNPDKLYKFSFEKNSITLADIIWAIRS